MDGEPRRTRTYSTLSTSEMIWNALLQDDLNALNILSKKSDIDFKFKHRDMPLIFVAKSRAAAEILVNAGVSLNEVKKSDGRTSLMHFAQNNKTEIVKFMLETKPDLEKKDLAGNTAIIYALAAINSNPDYGMDVLEQLMNAGANVTNPNNKGITPLESAALLELHEAFFFMAVNTPKLMKYLIGNQKVITKNDIFTDTAIMRAIKGLSTPKDAKFKNPLPIDQTSYFRLNEIYALLLTGGETNGRD